jgi:hypothetical protein
MAHPLMQPQIYNSDVLGASIRAARETTAERGALQAALARTRAEDQARREAEQEARGGVDHDAERSEVSAAEVLERVERPSRSDGGGPGRMPPPPALSDVQQELMAQALQQEPPQRAATFQPLSDRLLRWVEEGAEMDEEALNGRLRMLVQQYRDSRPTAAADSRRISSVNQHLHAMSLKLASIGCLSDFDRLTQQSVSDGGGSDGAAHPPADPSTHFYDLHSLDLDSYGDIKHLHASSVAPLSGAGTGWWRTQLAELDEDVGEKRRRDAALLAAMERPDPEEDDGHRGNEDDKVQQALQAAAPHFDRLDGAGRHQNGERSGLLLARNPCTTEAELEADLLSSDLRDSRRPVRLTAEQLLARTQGRSYRSASAQREVLLPEGQRILRPGEKARANPLEPDRRADHGRDHGDHDIDPARMRSDAVAEMDAALDENARGVQRPGRKRH